MEQRKSSDILLELENKINALLDLSRTQDLNIKILSNKLNEIKEKIDQKPVTPKFTMETDSSFNPYQPPQIPISPESGVSVETAPQGFRRTSRPETYTSSNPKPNLAQPAPEVQFPTQIPKSVKSEIIVPLKKKESEITFPEVKEEKQPTNTNVIPVVQRVTDGNGKAAFLASVEIMDLSTMNQIYKTKTNGTGKWMASLPIGKYRVTIKKTESLTKEKLENMQNITIDGLQSPLTLESLIMKR